jgi:hypothetical protein
MVCAVIMLLSAHRKTIAPAMSAAVQWRRSSVRSIAAALRSAGPALVH